MGAMHEHTDENLSHDHAGSGHSQAHRTSQQPPREAMVIVASTRAAAGEYEDQTGPILVEFFRRLGFTCPDATLVPDAQMEAHMAGLLGPNSDRAQLPRVIITTGGTGVTPDDRSVEAIAVHLERELPGIAHAFFERGLRSTPMAVVSRAVAGTVGNSFVMALPGSKGAVKDGCAVLEPIIGHLCDMLEGSHAH